MLAAEANGRLEARPPSAAVERFSLSASAIVCVVPVAERVYESDEAFWSSKQRREGLQTTNELLIETEVF